MSKDTQDEVADGINLLDLWLERSRLRSIFSLGFILTLVAVCGFFHPAHWGAWRRRKAKKPFSLGNVEE